MDAAKIHYDTLVLNLLANKPLYLYGIVSQLSEATGLSFGLFSVQCSLKRLSEQNAVSFEWHLYGGRDRKVFSITPEGRTLLRKQTAQLQACTKLLGVKA